MHTIRAFIALNLNKDVKEKISLLREKFKGMKGLKLVETHNLHITMKFLGDIKTSQKPQIVEALKKACSGTGKLNVVTTRIGAFPNKNYPKVLWLGIEHNPGIVKLHDNIENSLEALGFKRDKRKFHPHITLARNKNIRNKGKICREIENTKEYYINTTIEKVSLMKSVLKPTGPVYSIIEDIELT